MDMKHDVPCHGSVFSTCWQLRRHHQSTANGSHAVCDVPASKVPKKFRTTVVCCFGTYVGVRNGERTCDGCDSPWVVGFKYSLQDQTHDGELHDAADGGGDKRAADAEVEGGRDEGIEEDKRETEGDIAPGQGS